MASSENSTDSTNSASAEYYTNFINLSGSASVVDSASAASALISATSISSTSSTSSMSSTSSTTSVRTAIPTESFSSATEIVKTSLICGLIYIVFPTVILGIFSLVYATKNWDVSCDHNWMPLHVWLVVSGTVSIVFVVVLLSLNVTILYMVPQKAKNIVRLLICLYLLYLIFVLVWMLIGARAIRDYSDNCGEGPSSLYVMSMIVVFADMVVLAFLCTGGGLWEKYPMNDRYTSQSNDLYEL